MCLVLRDTGTQYIIRLDMIINLRKKNLDYIRRSSVANKLSYGDESWSLSLCMMNRISQSQYIYPTYLWLFKREIIDYMCICT